MDAAIGILKISWSPSSPYLPVRVVMFSMAGVSNGLVTKQLKIPAHNVENILARFLHLGGPKIACSFFGIEGFINTKSKLTKNS